MAGACLGFAGCALETETRAIGQSMEPTIRSGEIVPYDPDAYRHAAPRPLDIVSLRPPAGASRGRCGRPPRPRQACAKPTPGYGEGSFIKRVVAVGGDRVAIDANGHLVLNGRPLTEPFTIPCATRDACALPVPVTVPAGHFFVLGDNRPYSGDSRQWGPVTAEAIKGKVTPLDQ